MPTYKTSQEWLEQSSLLLQARPATTRITTKYSIKPIKPRKSKPSADDATNPAATEDAPMTDAKPPRGSLVLKTFDPASGVTLKYRTTKAAEVSRLITCLGTLSRTMSTSKEPVEVKDEPMVDAGAAAAGEDTPTGGVTGAPTPAGQQAGSGGGGGKKKKKGKK